MNNVKKLIRQIASVVAIIGLSIPVVFSADREILPVESTQQLRTPGVGLQDFITRMPTDQQLASCDFNSSLESEDPLDPKPGSIYVRMLWQHFEPAEGEYAWEKLDRIFECAHNNGKTVDLRLMLTYPGHKVCSASELAIDPQCVAYETLPDWLIDRVDTHTTDVFAEEEYQLPDWSDSLFIEKHDALIKALGTKYNNHPDLNSVDIGSVGAWGEWHIFGASAHMPTPEQQKAVVDLYVEAFPDTPLVAPADSFYEEERAEFGELSTYFRDTLQTGWRGDSWGLPYFNDDRYQPINDWMPDGWKNGPVLLEVSGAIDHWSGANVIPAQEEPTKHIQESIDDALSWHVSQLDLKSGDIPGAFKTEFQAFAKKMGFRLILRQASVPESAAADRSISITLGWENVGVAPPYRDFRIALRIKDQDGEIKAQTITEESVKGWLPGAPIVTSPSIILPTDLVAGNYALEVGLVFHSAEDRVLPIAVEGVGDDQWYPLGPVTVVNQAPVAADASITLRQDQQAEVTVEVADPENQTLTYRVVEAPEHGELTGELPSVVYVANEDHPGTDSFSYIANDGDEDSNIATVSLSVYPVITEGTANNQLALGSIAVDGDPSEWADVTSFGLDGDDLLGAEADADWQEAWMSHDDKRLYIAFKNNGPINASAAWPWSILLDVFPTAGTGFAANDNVGADFLLTTDGLYQYTGTGLDWSWKYVTDVNSSVQGDFAEISLLRSDLSQPSSMKVLFRADNSHQAGAYLVDNYPNGVGGYFTYNIDGLIENPFQIGEITNPLVSPLTLDGDITDWSAIPSLGVDGNDVTETNSQADILEAWMAHDDSDFYIAYRNDGDINTTTMWPWQVFIDTDNTLSTGMQVGNGIGAEFMIQGTGLYQYTGIGSDWSWQFLQDADSAIEGDVAELKLPQSAISSPYTVRFIILARNSSFTGSDSIFGLDRYPDERYGSLNYRFGTPESRLVIDGDLSDWVDITSLGEDGNDVEVEDSQADFLETWLTRDEENLYVAYRNDGPINQSTMWPWQVFFDTDRARETGYSVRSGFGADFMLQGRSLYKYIGTGSDWSWEYVSVTESSVIDDSAEFKISRADFVTDDVDVSDMHVLFRASNWLFTGSFAAEGYDYFPDQSDGGGGAYISLSF